MDPFIRTETCFVQAEKKARNPGKVMLSCGHQISNQPWPLCHWVEDRVPRYQWTQWLPPSDVGGGGWGQRPGVRAELGCWWVSQVGVFQVGVPAPDVEKWL